MNRTIRLISLFFVILCSVAMAIGQEQYGTLEITTKDANGAVVPGVAVTVTSTEGTTGFSRTVTTDDQGFARIPQMRPGTYELNAAATSGFSVTKLTGVQVQLGKATQINMQLSSTVGAVVDVTSSEVAVDQTSSDISKTLSTEKLELLPKGGNFSSVLKVIPGTRDESKSGGFSIDGASGAENTFIIDGQEVTNYRNAGLAKSQDIPFEMVQEIQVKSSGFNAEFGGATGGVINVVTKGGNNDFHGSFGTTFEPSGLQGSNRDGLYRWTSGSVGTSSFTQETEYFHSPKSDYVNSFPSANLSGPIIKNKVWFFGSYSPQVYDTNVRTTFLDNAPPSSRGVIGTEEYHATRVYNYAFGRIDAAPFSKLRLSSTYLWNPVEDHGVLPYGTVQFGNPSGTPEDYAKQGGRQTSNNVTFQAVYTPFNNVVGSFRYSRGYLNEKLGNYNIPSGLRYLCIYGNTPDFDFGPDACNQGDSDPSNTITVKDISVRTNYEGDVTFLFSGCGRHELKG